MKTDRTRRYSYHDCIGKNRTVEMVLYPSLTINLFFNLTHAIYLMHLSMQVKLVRIASEMGRCASFCCMFNNLIRGKFYNLY